MVFHIESTVHAMFQFPFTMQFLFQWKQTSLGCALSAGPVDAPLTQLTTVRCYTSPSLQFHLFESAPSFRLTARPSRARRATSRRAHRGRSDAAAARPHAALKLDGREPGADRALSHQHQAPRLPQ